MKKTKIPVVFYTQLVSIERVFTKPPSIWAVWSKSHAIFEQQPIALISSSPLKNGPKLKQQRRIFLIIQLDDISGPRDFTCVIPLTDQYDMLRDLSPYNVFDSYVSFIYATDSLENSNKKIYQLAFSSLLTLDVQEKPADVHFNIFASYFKKASFANKNDNITNIYRIYTNEILENWEYETVNYVILHFDATEDLRESYGHQCFSQFYDDSRNELLVSKCFENKYFQLVMLYGSEPEAHIQFYLHVDSDVFDKFISNCIEVDYGNDELYVAENDCFVVRLFSMIQRRRLNLLSLVEQSF